jgi:hypothetical protein
MCWRRKEPLTGTAFHPRRDNFWWLGSILTTFLANTFQSLALLPFGIAIHFLGNVCGIVIDKDPDHIYMISPSKHVSTSTWLKAAFKSTQP